jgi:hypothetical protein
MVSSSVSRRVRSIRWRAAAAMVLLLALTAGCKSPLDPDTPRLRFAPDVNPPDTAKTSHWLRAEITFSGSNSGAQWQHATDSSWAYVDTSHGRTAVRLMLAATMLPPYQSQIKFMHSFLLADTLVADGLPRSLTKDPSTGTGALFRIATGKDSLTVTPVETIVAGDPASGGATLTLTRASTERIARGPFVAYAQKYRLSLDGTITITW